MFANLREFVRKRQDYICFEPGILLSASLFIIANWSKFYWNFVMRSSGLSVRFSLNMFF